MDQNLAMGVLEPKVATVLGGDNDSQELQHNEESDGGRRAPSILLDMMASPSRAERETMQTIATGVSTSSGGDSTSSNGSRGKRPLIQELE